MSGSRSEESQKCASLNNEFFHITASALDQGLSLEIRGVDFSKIGTNILSEQLQKHLIVEVVFRDCKFSGNDFIDVLSRSKTLKRLDLANNPLTFEQGISILELGKRLTHLNLSNTVDFHDRYVDQEKANNQTIDVCNELKEINEKLEEYKRAEEAARNIKPATGFWSWFSQNKPQVTALDIHNIRQLKRTLAEVHGLAFWKAAGIMLKLSDSLQVIDLSNNIANTNGRHQAANQFMKQFAVGLENNHTLKSLALRQNDIVHHSLTVIADALQKNENMPLEILDLSDNCFELCDNPAGTLPQLLAKPSCQIKTLILSQQYPFCLKEVCEGIGSNPDSHLTLLAAEFSPEGPVAKCAIEDNSKYVGELLSKNDRITVKANSIADSQLRKRL